MPHAIEISTVQAVSLALDAASLRHQALAANIANVGTPNYRPLRVSFEEQLGALRAGLARGGAIDPSLIDAARPTLEREPLPSSGDAAGTVALDQQVAKISENAVHYQALLRALNKQFSILSTAINDGKR